MSIIGWMAGSVGVLTGSMAAGVYGLTVKAQKPRVIANEYEPSVPFEEVEWISHGKKVKGWFLPQHQVGGERNADSPTIIIAHGWGSNRAHVLRYALPLHADGYAILMYDARSHGESEYYRTPNGLQFRDDLLAAIEWIKSFPHANTSWIGVLGHSLGAFGAVLALEQNSSISALVTDSMPVKFATMVGAELKRRRLPEFPLAQLIPGLMVWRSGITRKTMKRANPVRILKENEKTAKTPVMLVHSNLDPFIPSTELQYVLSHVPNIPHLFVDAEGHSASDRDPEFWPAVTRFFASTR
ncbi:MAG: alpha/beta fold hydrolase [Candidatus Cohnella colombiensis]|uniref:Alpha/beta fold hydrolase n=1 Tax=Candidatus Cohnella colombiensis TaxID=3121368 RepID=A0AA95JDE5_9BACL|nr:MAG: alpha/beta fold hydrolase [Cohnella sp.]